MGSAEIPGARTRSATALSGRANGGHRQWESVGRRLGISTKRSGSLANCKPIGDGLEQLEITVIQTALARIAA